MASSFNAIFGGSTGVPLGSIVAGQLANTAGYLPCDGNDYVSATYPLLDKTNLATFGSNAWVARTLPTSQVWSSCAFGNNIFVAVSSTSGTAAASSTDGQTWTGRTIPTGAYNFVVFAAGIFVAVGLNVCATSTDGITWTTRTISAINFTGLAYGAGLFVAVASNSSSYATSPDGITWTSRATTTGSWSGFPRNVAFGNNQFCVVPFDTDGATTVNGYAYFSNDGLTWLSSGYMPIQVNWGSSIYFQGKWYLFAINNGNVLTTQDSGLTWGSIVFQAYTPTGYYWPSAYNLNGLAFFAYGNARSTIRNLVDSFTPQVKSLPSSLLWGPMAYGNNICVILQAATGTSAASLAFDTTKFRTPKAAPVADTDRLYIKVA